MSDIQIVRAEDPRVGDLEAAGYRLVGESWGARLRLPAVPDLSAVERAVSRAEESGIVIRELTPDDADALYDLELANNADYPFTPATFQAPPERESIRSLWESGKRVFGALDGGVLVAAAVGQVVDGIGDNDFASVLRTHRGRGLGTAVAAASIIAFANDGVRVFAAGGAGVNAASLGLVQSLGFQVEEQWRSYERH
jgi:ribosomal protein S18 acetylase RimI-like enzyme